MSTVLSTLYRKLHNKDREEVQSYWTTIRYSGYVIDEITLITASGQLKHSLIKNVISLLPTEYKELNSNVLNLIVATTLFDDGFLLTPIEALEALEILTSELKDYKILATHVSAISIRERIKRALETWGNGNDFHSYVASQAISKLLPLNSIYDLSLLKRVIHPINVHKSMELNYFDTLYDIYIPQFFEYVNKKYNRKLILDTIKNNYYVYLKGLFPVYDSKQNPLVLDVPCSASEAHNAIRVLKKEITINYYEPILYTRFDKTMKSAAESMATADVYNMNFIEYADIYSKVVRLSNIRRRLILQDARYVIMEAIKAAFVKIYNELIST